MTRRQWAFALLTLVALRLMIGWHFYLEGVTKIREGNFSAAGFFANANGPFSGYYRSLINDYDGRIRLGLVQTKNSAGDLEWTLDPLVTEETWKGFVYRAASHYGFEDAGLLDSIEHRRQALAKQLGESRNSGASSSSRASDLQRQIAAADALYDTVSKQKSAALAVVQRYIDQLRELLNANTVEILAYFRGETRVDSKQQGRVGEPSAAEGVESLWQQVKQIRSDRKRDASSWLTEVNAMWQGLEADINALATDEQSARGYLPLERPDQPRYSLIGFVDRIIPWFDTIVGALLMLGLFTRTAAFGGAALLLGVISTQPPFYLGSAPTIYQFIELAGIIVLFAFCAGRVAGLDALFFKRRRTPLRTQPES